MGTKEILWLVWGLCLMVTGIMGAIACFLLEKED